MHLIAVRNVTEALPAGVEYLKSAGLREKSRAGPVLVSPRPVVTEYGKPTERVLFSPIRDANPFFHLVESLWMLAGRGDAALLDHFVKDFGERFAEPDGVIHGAYGYRWRRSMGFDQLEHIIAMLRKDPGTRQAVLQMWDSAGAWGSGGSNDLGGEGVVDKVLDMTVCCRSNDIVMGAYGANAVHFSVLQEYVASMVGVEVGTYYQVSNNYHLYISDLERLEKRNADAGSHYALETELLDNRYASHDLRPQKLVDDPGSFDSEVVALLAMHEALLAQTMLTDDAHEAAFALNNTFLGRTVWPMLTAHRALRNGDHASASVWWTSIQAMDWRVVTREWIQRRDPRRKQA